MCMKNSFAMIFFLNLFIKNIQIIMNSSTHPDLRLWWRIICRPYLFISIILFNKIEIKNFQPKMIFINYKHNLRSNLAFRVLCPFVHWRFTSCMQPTSCGSSRRHIAGVFNRQNESRAMLYHSMVPMPGDDSMNWPGETIRSVIIVIFKYNFETK